MTDSRHVVGRRSGFALPAAIIALVLLSALVAGSLFISTEELRSGRSDIADQRALAEAEWALERSIADWDPQRNTGRPVGSTDVMTATASAPNDSVTVTAVRVGRHALWLTSAARVGGDGRMSRTRRTIGASLRLAGANIPLRAALTTLGGASVDGGVIDGRDQPASDSSGLCAGSESAAGVLVSDASRVMCITCSAESGTGLLGVPPIDSGLAADSSFWRFGDESPESLAARASIVLPAGTFAPRPSVRGGECDVTDPVNWGDPSPGSACANRWPVIHVRGSVVLASGSAGQGILVADGAVRVEAGARFVGVVFASGEVDVDGVGAEIVGAAFAAASGGTGVSSVRAGGAVRFARCAVRRAMLGTARLARTPGRWWVELR